MWRDFFRALVDGLLAFFERREQLKEDEADARDAVKDNIRIDDQRRALRIERDVAAVPKRLRPTDTGEAPPRRGKRGSEKPLQ